MKCSTAERQLTPYLDERLDAEARQALESHLSLCPRCQEQYALLKATRAALASEGPAEPTPGLAARVANLALAQARPRAAAPMSDWLGLLRWPALATATATAALALVLFLEAPRPTPSPSPSDAATTFAQLVSLDDADLDPFEEGARVLGQEVE